MLCIIGPPECEQPAPRPLSLSTTAPHRLKRFAVDHRRAGFPLICLAYRLPQLRDLLFERTAKQEIRIIEQSLGAGVREDGCFAIIQAADRNRNQLQGFPDYVEADFAMYDPFLLQFQQVLKKTVSSGKFMICRPRAPS